MKAMCPLPPFCEEVFSAEEVKLSDFYLQLYSHIDMTALPISVTHQKFGHVLLAGDLIGLQIPGQNSKSLSVIMAYWPSTGQDLSSIDSSAMQVGTAQYFMQHKFHFHITGKVKEGVYLFACVKWKRLHTHYDWFGLSATVCDNIEELECMNFIPV